MIKKIQDRHCETQFIFRGNRAQPGGIKVRELEALPE